MKKIITSSFLVLFSICLLSSYMMVKSKVKKETPSFMISKTQDIKNDDAKKLVSSYNPEKNYYWKYKLQKTYHSKGMSIYYTTDTLSTELKVENK